MLNFDEFNDYGVLKSSSFTKYYKVLKTEYKKGTHICIMTARSDNQLIRRFFLDNDIDIHPDLCITVSDPMWEFVGSSADKKQQAFKMLIEKGYKNFIFLMIVMKILNMQNH